MQKIDGSQGEGGGQILRTSLSLSACTGREIHLQNIRKGRKKPGLMRQHLACVEALKQVCSAEVTGAYLGSDELVFKPGFVQPGNYRFVIGSAGSTTLVFQTVLAPLLLTGEPSLLQFEGGTHNPMAPSYDFIKYAFLPALNRMGLGYEIAIESYGFFPVGGGCWQISIKPPQQFKDLEIHEYGDPKGMSARCISAGVPNQVLQREKQRLLKLSGWADHQVVTESVPAKGSGNIVLIKADYSQCSEVVDSIGKIGMPAETVATNAYKKMRKYLSHGAPVSTHLADQLLLPMVITAGGQFTTGPLSQHSKTNIEVINKLFNSKLVTVDSNRELIMNISVKGVQ